MGSFLMSVTTGKNQVHLLHPIFAVGAKPAENDSDSDTDSDREDETISTHLSLKELSILQQQQQHQQQYDHSANTTATTATAAAGAIIDRSQMERNRLYRRASLTKRMEVPGNRSYDSRPPASSTTTATTASTKTTRNGTLIPIAMDVTNPIQVQNVVQQVQQWLAETNNNNDKNYETKQKVPSPIRPRPHLVGRGPNRRCRSNAT